MKRTDLEKDISSLLNRYSIESYSNTPDYILARYLMSCLLAFENAVIESFNHKNKTVD